jgi:hypothetical protein
MLQRLQADNLQESNDIPSLFLQTIIREFAQKRQYKLSRPTSLAYYVELTRNSPCTYGVAYYLKQKTH